MHAKLQWRQWLCNQRLLVAAKSCVLSLQDYFVDFEHFSFWARLVIINQVNKHELFCLYLSLAISVALKRYSGIIFGIKMFVVILICTVVVFVLFDVAFFYWSILSSPLCGIDYNNEMERAVVVVFGVGSFLFE